MSTPKDKLTPEQALASLRDDVELDSVAEKLDDMTEEELDALLASKGITPEQVKEDDAKARAMVEKAQASDKANDKKRSNVVDIRSARRLKTRWAAIGVMAGGIAAAAGVPLYMTVNNLQMVSTNTVTDAGLHAAAGDWTDSDKERFQAYEAYVNGRYEACLMHLDRAKELEPDSEFLGSVQRTRAWCKKGLDAQPRDP